MGLFLLLACCFADPEPVETFFKPGWDKPVDPDKDCKFVQAKDSLTIRLPAKDHDFDTKRRKYYAPRMLREVKGQGCSIVARAWFQREAGEGKRPPRLSSFTNCP